MALNDPSGPPGAGPEQADRGPEEARPTPASIILAELLRTCPPRLAAQIARVGRMSEKLARRLGLDEAEAAEIGRAGSLHDIGMAFVPEELLDQAGLLSVREKERVHHHDLCGLELLQMAGDPTYALAAMVARQHQERWDGSGQPAGLAGEEICLAARIVAVCAAYEALRHPWPGKVALGHGPALALLVRGHAQVRATAFDPRVVAAFVRHGAEFQAMAAT
jgi:HD-GYP domain-containing protein (c-di-GMP phosphodiesterase class II)